MASDADFWVNPMASESRDYIARLEGAVKWLTTMAGTAPGSCLCLGSGLGGPDRRAAETVSFPYDRIPHFPIPRVTGHGGKLEILGAEKNRYCCLHGRVHLYEGFPIQEVVFTVRALALWGVKRFALTNAAGGIAAHLVPGDLMLIADHINLIRDQKRSARV